MPSREWYGRTDREADEKHRMHVEAAASKRATMGWFEVGMVRCCGFLALCHVLSVVEGKRRVDAVETIVFFLGLSFWPALFWIGRQMEKSRVTMEMEQGYARERQMELRRRERLRELMPIALEGMKREVARDAVKLRRKLNELAARKPIVGAWGRVLRELEPPSDVDGFFDEVLLPVLSPMVAKLDEPAYEYCTFGDKHNELELAELASGLEEKDIGPETLRCEVIVRMLQEVEAASLTMP